MNDIVTRIKIFLQSMGIANSAFADVCGIPRPSLSQMLNGRNRKVSNEVIDKIHAAYPQLNMMWLLFGDGDMLRSSDNPDVSDGELSADNAFPGSAQTADEQETHQQQSINFDDIDDNASVGYTRRKSDLGTRRAALSPANGNVATVGQQAPSTRPNGVKYVKQIMLIFSDGSTQHININ